MAKVYANGLALYEVGARGTPAHPREVGWAVSASVAMFNHDCTPNVDWALDRSGCLVVRTLRQPLRCNTSPHTPLGHTARRPALLQR